MSYLMVFAAFFWGTMLWMKYSDNFRPKAFVPFTYNKKNGSHLRLVR